METHPLMGRGRRGLLAAFVAAGLMLAAGGRAARAQPDQVDALLTKLFGTDETTPYTLSADFSGYILATIGGAPVRAEAEGSFQEWRDRNDVRRRTVRLRTLRLPLLLRPFSGALRRAVEEKIEAQADAPEAFVQHDVFILDELPAGRFVLAGVDRGIVTGALKQYGRPEDERNIATRRNIARWLYTSPAMRGFLVRGGPPYAVRAVVDDTGLLHELVLFYDWGAITTRVDFVVVSKQPVASRIVADTVSTLPGVGRVTGRLVLTFSNHCVNCARP
jgi:hypothetical protein